MVDLYAGLGGWAEGGLAEGYDVVGFDIERHQYGEHRYPAQLVIQDVTTLNGAQFKDAALIVASPPCQEYSYMAMPWKRAKAKAAAIRADKSGAELEKLNRLFSACWRIKLEASAAAGRSVPMVIENVKGAQLWVGRARWSFGSFYLWGDVPALMPITFKGIKVPSFRFDGSGKSFQSASVRRTAVGNGVRFTSRDCGLENGRKMPGIELGEIGFNVAAARQYSHMVEGVKIERSDEDKRHHIGTKRKFASAMIAKIPEPLARHIAKTYRS